jgi:hypothetical protein
LIDERLAGVGKGVLQQHSINLAHLAEINALTGIVEEAKDDLFDIKDLQEDLGEMQSSVMV